MYLKYEEQHNNHTFEPSRAQQISTWLQYIAYVYMKYLLVAV